MPSVGHAVTSHAHEIRWLVWPVLKVGTWLDVVASSILSSHSFSNILSIMGIILRRLLSINQCDSINVVVLIVVGILVAAHDELFLCSFKADGSYRFGTFARNINISHIRIIIRSTSLLLNNILMLALVPLLYWVTKLACWLDCGK